MIIKSSTGMDLFPSPFGLRDTLPLWAGGSRLGRLLSLLLLLLLFLLVGQHGVNEILAGIAHHVADVDLHDEAEAIFCCTSSGDAAGPLGSVDR